jgi:hypothetical protein
LIDSCDIEGVRAVVAQLEAIQKDADKRAPLHRHDGVACFNHLYKEITKNVLRCVENVHLHEGDPHFRDLPFMACLDVSFANRYLAALGYGDSPPFQPRCWQGLIDHRDMRDISPLIFAVAGVNAHVNFDLPFALITTCSIMGRELESGSNDSDYELINDIFAGHMQRLRRHFESRFVRGFDTAMVSKVENVLGDKVVVLARYLAWRSAKQMWPDRADEATMLRRAKSRDRMVAWSNQGLFQLDRVPALVFRAMRLVPGAPRKAANKGLGRTGWFPATTEPTAPTAPTAPSARHG